MRRTSSSTGPRALRPTKLIMFFSRSISWRICSVTRGYGAAMIVERWSGVFIDPGSGKSFRAVSYGHEEPPVVGALVVRVLLLLADAPDDHVGHGVQRDRGADGIAVGEELLRGVEPEDGDAARLGGSPAR